MDNLITNYSELRAGWQDGLRASLQEKIEGLQNAIKPNVGDLEGIYVEGAVPRFNLHSENLAFNFQKMFEHFDNLFNSRFLAGGSAVEYRENNNPGRNEIINFFSHMAVSINAPFRNINKVNQVLDKLKKSSKSNLQPVYEKAKDLVKDLAQLALDLMDNLAQEYKDYIEDSAFKEVFRELREDLNKAVV